ncbi:MAG: hypothetical protein ACREER_06555 [Alphaproteobacteria bacterium]
MDDLTYLFTVALVVAALLAAIAIAAPRKTWVRLTALAVAMLFVPVGYAALTGLLSRPKPVGLEWARLAAREATVLGASIAENQGIYVWLQFSGSAEPRAFVLPWDRDLAEELQEALREAERNGTGVVMNLPFERSLDPREPRFHVLPQPALPPKDGGRPPEDFEPPGQAT